MATTLYSAKTGAAVALVAATAKTVLMVNAPAQFGIDLRKFRLYFDGSTASAVPVYWEITSCTLATNSTPGTGNTAGSVVQLNGRSITAGFAALYNATAEPTVQTSLMDGYLTPTGGALIYDWPLGDSPDSAVSSGLAIRCTAPAAVNVRAELQFGRC